MREILLSVPTAIPAADAEGNAYLRCWRGSEKRKVGIGGLPPSLYPRVKNGAICRGDRRLRSGPRMAHTKSQTAGQTVSHLSIRLDHLPTRLEWVENTTVSATGLKSTPGICQHHHDFGVNHPLNQRYGNNSGDAVSILKGMFLLDLSRCSPPTAAMNNSDDGNHE